MVHRISAALPAWNVHCLLSTACFPLLACPDLNVQPTRCTANPDANPVEVDVSIKAITSHPEAAWFDVHVQVSTYKYLGRVDDVHAQSASHRGDEAWCTSVARSQNQHRNIVYV